MYIYIALKYVLLKGERATWRMDRMIFPILINLIADAIQTSVVCWSVDIRAARRAPIAGAKHDCQSNAIVTCIKFRYSEVDVDVVVDLQSP